MNEEQMFKKLDELRLSGEINMFGAPTYMANNWGMLLRKLSELRSVMYSPLLKIM
jgi:hypothetical protein